MHSTPPPQKKRNLVTYYLTNVLSTYRLHSWYSVLGRATRPPSGEIMAHPKPAIIGNPFMKCLLLLILKVLEFYWFGKIMEFLYATFLVLLSVFIYIPLTGHLFIFYISLSAAICLFLSKNLKAACLRGLFCNL